MAFATSSILGASFTAADSTALFALNTKALGSDNSEFQYVIATGTLTTGMCVYINTAGTAAAFTTAQLNAAVTGGIDLGFAQFTMVQGSYGYVAKRGTNMYVLCSGTVPGGSPVAFGPIAGALVTSLLAAAGQTAAGIFVTTSASTATQSVAVAILTYPRPLAGVPQA